MRRFAVKLTVQATVRGFKDLDIKIQWCGEIAECGSPRILPAEEIHVWCRPLDFPCSSLGVYEELLSADERERAARYRFDQSKTEYILTRATLRALLASYLDKSPRSIEFSFSGQGKPSLATPDADLFFNVSHTDGLAALAFARGREIGVDVEKLRPECEAQKLAERFFSDSERQFLSRLSGRALHESFFRCWTRKEAFIKAKGGGLSIPLDQFDVAIAEHQPAALLGTRPDPGEVGRWRLYDLSVGNGYAGAVAVSAAELAAPVFPPEIAKSARS